MNFVSRYILDEQGQPKPEPDLLAWAGWYEKNAANRHVALTQIHNQPVTVSTVFLALDHNFAGEGPPILWETMVFGGAHDEYQRRYSSREAALVGHARAVLMVKTYWYRIRYVERFERQFFSLN